MHVSQKNKANNGKGYTSFPFSYSRDIHVKLPLIQ